ncbi:MAG: Amuc_1099 family pilus-like system protein [Roseibacillus sp.]|jgi:hypothetical protein
MAANLSASYDKVILGFALVIALGLGAMVYLNAGKVEDDFPAPGGGRNGVPEMEGVAGYEAQTSKVGVAVTLAHSVTKDGRTINNFVGIPLFLKGDSDTAVDLGDPSNPPVHPPIPNLWWLENRIDPGYADSPDRDPDKDGFSNLEEFNAKSNPNDFKSIPALIAKLECAKVEEKRFRLVYSSDTTTGPLKEEDTYSFKHEERINRRSKFTNSEYIQPGKGAKSTIFPAGSAQLRYEFKKAEQKVEKNPANGLEETNNYATLEDLSPAKKGDKIELKKGSRNGVIVRDYTAHLFLNAIGQADKVIKIAERTSFSLPFDPSAADKPYTFAAVTDSGDVVIEWQEGGEAKSMTLPPNSQP